MKVAASPQIYMGRCPKVVCKSPVTSHSYLLSNFRVSPWGGSPLGLTLFALPILAHIDPAQGFG